MSPLSPDPMARAPQPPKQPVPCQNSHQISSKKPKKAEVRVQRAQVISIDKLPITEPKGRDAHDGCSDNGIHGGTRLPPFCIMFQTNNPGAWSEIGAYPWVKNIVQGGGGT